VNLFKSSNGAKQEAPAPSTKSVEPRHITGAEFDAVVLTAQVPAVVDFWAEWCVPCHQIAPAVAQLASEYDGRAVITKLDADEYPDILSRYGIMGIPTLIYFRDGKEVDRQVGMAGYSTLKNKLERVLALTQDASRA
jgi:thioredoxin 1